MSFESFGDVSDSASAPIQRSWTHQATLPQPDLLEFAASSDVSIVVKHEI